MHTVRTFKTILALSALSLATTVYAQPGRGMGDGQGRGARGNQDGRPNWSRMADDLELTAAQQRSLMDMRHDFQAEMIPLQAGVKTAALDVRRHMTAETVDTAALNAALDAESAAKLALRKARVAHQLKVREVIGSENADRMQQNRRGGPGGQGGKGGQGGRW